MVKHIAVGFVAFVLLLAGCGDGNKGVLGTPQDAAATTPNSSPAPGGATFPGPRELLKTAAGTGDATVEGADYNPAWPNNKVTPVGTIAVCSPAAGDPLVLDDMAYAVYAFYLGEFTPEDRVLFDWRSAPGADGMYVALSQWGRDRWQWFNPAEAGVLPVDGLDGYIDDSGRLLLVLALAGTDQAVLNSITVPGSNVQQDNWWCFGHDRQHTGRSIYRAASIPHVKWRYFADGGFYGSACIGADGTVYTGNTNGNLYAFNPEGDIEWVFDAGTVIEQAPAVAADGTIYVVNISKSLIALNPDGTMKWTVDVSEGIITSPAIGSDSTIYISSIQGQVYAFNPDGTLRWKVDLGTDFSGSNIALAPNGTIYIQSVSNPLHAIGPDGTVLWAAYGELDEAWNSPAVAPDGTVYIACRNNEILALNPDGSTKWSIDKGAINHTGPALGADNTVYFGFGNLVGGLLALNPDGTEQWVFSGDYEVLFSSPVIDGDGTIYFGTWDYPYLDHGSFVAVNPDGTEQWLYQMDEMVSPVIGNDGTIYVGTKSGVFYAFGTGTGPVEITGVSPGERFMSQTTNKLAPEFTGSCDENTTFTWDFGGGATPDTSTEYQPEVTFGDPGRYNASITVSTPGFTADTYEFELEVIDPGPGDWCMFGQNAMHHQRSTGTGPQNPELKWNLHFYGFYYVDKESDTRPVFAADGTAYLNREGGLYAVAPNGECIWAYKLTETRTSYSPAIGADGTVYVAQDSSSSASGVLTAVNPDGSVKWQFQLSTGPSAAPTVGDDNTIYVTCYDTVYAINSDGSEAWSAGLPANSRSSPAVDDNGVVYVGCLDHQLYAINPDGSQKWTFATQQDICSSPTIGLDGTIYIGSRDHWLYAVNPDGSLKWAYDTGYWVDTTAGIGADGTVYLVSNRTYAFSPDGELKWSLEYNTVDPKVLGMTIDAAGSLYISGTDDVVYSVSKDGQVNWTVDAEYFKLTSIPVLRPDGVLYVCCEHNKLIAFGEAQ